MCPFSPVRLLKRAPFVWTEQAGYRIFGGDGTFPTQPLAFWDVRYAITVYSKLVKRRTAHHTPQVSTHLDERQDCSHHRTE